MTSPHVLSFLFLLVIARQQMTGANPTTLEQGEMAGDSEWISSDELEAAVNGQLIDEDGHFKWTKRYLDPVGDQLLKRPEADSDWVANPNAGYNKLLSSIRYAAKPMRFRLAKRNKKPNFSKFRQA